MLHLFIVLSMLLILCMFSKRSLSLEGGGEVIFICTDDDDQQDGDKQAVDVDRHRQGNSFNKRQCNMQLGTDYYGNTFETVKTESPEECCRACKENAMCQGWTYDTREQVCRLKSIIPDNGTNCPYRISGKK